MAWPTPSTSSPSARGVYTAHARTDLRGAHDDRCGQLAALQLVGPIFSSIHIRQAWSIGELKFVCKINATRCWATDIVSSEWWLMACAAGVRYGNGRKAGWFSPWLMAVQVRRVCIDVVLQAQVAL